MFPRREHVQFTGALGHRIAARLDSPAGDPRAYALFAHCFTCTKDLKAVAWISRELVDRRMAMLRFDFTGLGESEGDFADTNFTSNLDDLVAAADFLRTSYRAPQILIGHSLGGTAVIAAAKRIPEARCVVTIAAPCGTEQTLGFVTRQVGSLGRGEATEINVMGRSIRIKGQLLDDLRQHGLLRDIAELGLPLLVFHSPNDDVIPIEHGRRIFDAAKYPKNFISLDGADHLLIAREDDARYVAELIASWATRYLA
jgi:alpha/beta superfamily hydrolase